MLGCAGDLGTGKSLLMAILAAIEVDFGKLVFTNFHLNYKSSTGKKAYYVPPQLLHEWFKAGHTRFPLNMGSIYLDEAYMYLESRAPSRQTTDFSYLILQSRKMGLDVYFAVQLTSSIDKRLRYLTNFWIICERASMDGIHNDFRFVIMDGSGRELNELYITEEVAEKHLYGIYDTQELVSSGEEAEDLITAQEIDEVYAVIKPFSR